MATTGVKWKHAARYFLAHGYELRHSGGDIVIIAPRADVTQRHVRAPVRIGHLFSNSPNAELLPVHLKRIRLAFGVTKDDILAQA